MKSRRFLHPSTCFFLLMGMVVFVSWVGSACGWPGVRSLLSSEGLRWALRASGKMYVQSPVLPVVMVLFLGAGLWIHSGLGKACMSVLSRGGSLSRKERRALTFSLLVSGLYVCGFALLVWGPWSVASSVVGTFRHSPLEDGFWCILSLGMALPSVAYGFASDTYVSDRDVVEGMSSLFVRKASSFVSLLFVLLFFASLEYTGLPASLGIPPGVVEWVGWGCSLLVFLC